MAMTTEIERNAMMHTESLCPICLRVLEAFIVEENGNASMLKTCPEHGSFETVLWRSKTPMNEWIRTKERAYIKNPITEVDKGCPFDCGLCSAHRQHTCTALIEVTSRCNLSCRFCFADAMDAKSNDPTLEQVRFQFESILKVSGRCNIQLSGGEPTVRDDLAEIIRIGVELGFPFIQVNTNGIRMAKDEAYVKALKEAGLSSLFYNLMALMIGFMKHYEGVRFLSLKLKRLKIAKSMALALCSFPPSFLM